MTIVSQFCKCDGQFLLFVHGHFIQAQRFQIVVRKVQDAATGGFIYAATFHADQTIFHNVQKPDTVFTADFVERENNIFGAHFLIVEFNRNALFKFQCNIGRLVRRINGGNAHFQKALLFILRLVSCIFQVQTLMGQMPEVLVFGIVGFTIDFQGNVMFFRVFDLFLTALDVPFTPGSDDGHVGGKRFDRQFKTNLVVSFSGATVADCISTLGKCDLCQTFRNWRTCQRCAQQVFFVHSAGFDGRNDVFVDKFICQIFHI